MDIIIKSFNRPYYLDRCLQSIDKNVHGNFQITVVDDGTPQRYLDKILEKFPSVTIIKTKLYSQKSQNVEYKSQHLPYQKVMGYPARDWIKAVENSISDHIMVIEDDIWFTEFVNLDNLLSDISLQNISLVKLAWQGMPINKSMITEEQTSEILVRQLPKNIKITSHKLIKHIYFNKYKLKSILHRLKVIDHNFINNYYALFSISMGLYKKDYWLKIWENIDGSFMELNQIANAGANYTKDLKIYRTSKECLKTSYISSATDSDHKSTSPFDIDFFNWILNENWHLGKFNSMENYPKDFSSDYIQCFLNKANLKEARDEDWKEWAENFKSQFRALGANVDD